MHVDEALGVIRTKGSIHPHSRRTPRCSLDATATPRHPYQLYVSGATNICFLCLLDVINKHNIILCLSLQRTNSLSCDNQKTSSKTNHVF